MYPGHATTLFIALSCTVFIVHTIIVSLIGELASAKQWIQIAITMLASGAIISFITKVTASAFSRITPLFKIAMGKYYMRGTWIGTILTERKNRIVFVEHYDQTTIGLTIRGWGFPSMDSNFQSKWVTLCVALDPEKAQMKCLYETHVRNIDGRWDDIRFGTGRFSFNGFDSSGVVKQMEGVAVDEYHEGSLTYEICERISSNLLDIEEAKKLAFEKFWGIQPISKIS